MLLPELRTLARNRSIRPQTRLRVLIDAGPHTLKGVDVVSVYLHAQRVPFARSIIRAREQLIVPDSESDQRYPVLGDTDDRRYWFVRNKYRWWPFHFGGIWDRVPLLASLEPCRGNPPFKDASPNEGLKWQNVEFSDQFVEREEIRSFCRFSSLDEEDPSLLVFLNSRKQLTGDDRVDEPLVQYAGMLREVASEIAVPAREIALYDHITTEFVSNAQVHADTIRDALKERRARPDATGQALKAFYNWLVHDLGRLCAAPDVRIHAYCVETQSGGNSRSPACRRLRLEPENDAYILSPYAVSGLSMYSILRTQDMRRFQKIHHLLTKLDKWKAEAGTSNEKQSDICPHWTAYSSGHFLVDEPCGLVTWAAHKGMTLYVEDVNRRFCKRAPHYGAAYTTLDPLTRFNFVVPLLRPTDNGEYCALGVVLFESRRVAALRAREAAFLASLISLAAKCLPPEAFKRPEQTE